jgi:hypothetical protein
MEFNGDLTTYFKTIVREHVEQYELDTMYQEAYDFIDSFYSDDRLNCCYMKEWFSEHLIENGLITLGPLHDAIIQSIEWDSSELYEFMKIMNYNIKLNIDEE